MNYKKIFRNQKIRFFVLRSIRFIPKKLIIKFQYFLKLKRFPKLNKPERYTEKLQWYKLNYRNDLMTKCADKYLVREYVSSKEYSHILNELIFVTDDVEDLDLSKLPEEFVIKTTNGCGSNYFCSNITENELNAIKKKLKWWMKQNLYYFGLEWSYKNIKPRIIVERTLVDKFNKYDGINDYKFICTNGEPHYVVLDVDRAIGHKRNIYNMNWELQEVSTDYPNIQGDVSCPKNFEEMKNIARKLSEGFPHVRIDLYNIDGKVYFGEMTFYPWTGYVQFKPDNFDFVLGGLFELPNKRHE